MNQDEARRGARQRLARRLLVKGGSSSSSSPSDSQVSRGARRASAIIVDENRNRKISDQGDVDKEFKESCTPERKSAEGRLEGERIQVGELVVVLTPPEETRQPSSTLFPFVSCPSPTFSFRPKKRSTLRSSFTRSDSSFSISSRTRTSGPDSSPPLIQRSDSIHQEDLTTQDAGNEVVDYDTSTDVNQDGLWEVSPTPFSTPSQELPSNPFGFDSDWVPTPDEEPDLKELGPALHVFGIEATSDSQMEAQLVERLEDQQVGSPYVTTPPPDAPLPTLPTSTSYPDVTSTSETHQDGNNTEIDEPESADESIPLALLMRKNSSSIKKAPESPEQSSSSAPTSADSPPVVDSIVTKSDLCTVSVENSDLSPPKMKEDKKDKIGMGKTLKTFRSFTKLLKLGGSDGKKNTMAKQSVPALPTQVASNVDDQWVHLDGGRAMSPPDGNNLTGSSKQEVSLSVVPCPPRPDSVDLMEDANDSNQTPTKKPVIRKLSLASFSNVLRSSNRKKSLESLRGARSSSSSDVPKSSLSEDIPDVPPIPDWVKPSEGVDSPVDSPSNDVQAQSSPQSSPSTPTAAPTPTLTSTPTSKSIGSPINTQTPDRAPVSEECEALERPSFAIEATSWALAIVCSDTPTASPTETAFRDIHIKSESKTELEHDEKKKFGEDMEEEYQQLLQSAEIQVEKVEENVFELENVVELGRELELEKEEKTEEIKPEEKMTEEKEIVEVARVEVAIVEDERVEEEKNTEAVMEQELSVDTELSTSDPDPDTDTDTDDEGFFDAEEGESDKDFDGTGSDQAGELNNDDDLSHAVIEVVRTHSGSTVSASVSTVSSSSSAPSSASNSTSLSTPSPTPYMADAAVLGELSGSTQKPLMTQLDVNRLSRLDTGGMTGDQVKVEDLGHSLGSGDWGVTFASLNFEDLELDLGF